MEKFTVLTATAAPLMRPNIDTDSIIRVERMVGLSKDQLGPWALEMMRYRPDGSEEPDFVLNREPWRHAKIIVAANNFGCGSSREEAVWALHGFGIRAVIAPSFGDIFFGNCFNNGVLPIRLPEVTVNAIGAEVAQPAGSTLTVDLEAQCVLTASGARHPFEIEPMRRRMLLEGMDAIALSLTHDKDIAAFQLRDRERRPWLWNADGKSA